MYLLDKEHAYDFLCLDTLAIRNGQIDLFVDWDTTVPRETNLSKGFIIQFSID
jgi:hypothetical protein